MQHEKILILDFGSQYTQLIARRVRELNIYSEIHPYNKLPDMNGSWKAVILSGSPFSVHEENAPILAQRLAILSEMEQVNPVTRDLIMRKIAVDRVLDLGISQIAVGMITGAMRNLIQTGFYETLTQFRQPTTFFSAMPGVTFRERLSNFLNTNVFSQNRFTGLDRRPM